MGPEELEPRKVANQPCSGQVNSQRLSRAHEESERFGLPLTDDRWSIS